MKVNPTAMEHPMAHTKGQPVTLIINRMAWHEGIRCSRAGGSPFDNPYPLGSVGGYSWVSGFIGWNETRPEDEVASRGGAGLLG